MFSFTPQQKFIFAVVGIVVLYLALALFCIVPGRKGCGPEAEKADLVMWGVFDNSDMWGPIIAKFQAQYPDVKIRYQQIPIADYEEELFNAFAAGKGPDIFYLQNVRLPKFIDKVTPMPQGEGWMTFAQYRDTFVDVVAKDLTRDSAKVFGVPLYADTLALYYNRDLLNAAGIAEPPKTWEEFQNDVERLTIIDSNGNIIRSGAAMGTARNINRSTDIIGLLMLQTFGNIPMIDVSEETVNFTRSLSASEGTLFSPGVDSLRFYTDFANPALKSYTWNRKQHYSIDAFVEGNVAMMLNYSHHIATIRSRAPQLNFGVTRAPQPKALLDAKEAIDYAGYFALVASKTSSQHKTGSAWKFLQFVAQKPQQDAYRQATALPPARRDLINELFNDPDYGVFAQQALTARSWYQPDSVAVETIFSDMIESVIDGTSVREAVQRAEGEVLVSLRKSPEGKKD